MKRGLQLGATPSGSDWCLKALHPSDPMVEVRGIPDESAVPSVFLNYQTVTKVGAPSGATGTWSYDGVMIPHPVQFMTHKVTATTSGTTESVYSDVLNAQLDGATHLAKYNSFRGQARRWRLAYMSITVHQDGPSLADQGTIVATQIPVQPKVYNPSGQWNGTLSTSRDMVLGPHVLQFSDLDRPSYTASQAMPNAYFNQSKHGCYMPLKLTRTHQEWKSDADHVAVLYDSTDNDPDEVGNAYDMGYARVTYGAGSTWPFTSLVGFNPSLKSTVAFSDTGTGHAQDWAATRLDTWQGQVTSPLCNDTWGTICARNMSVDTSFSIFIRVGFEVQVVPTSILSPQQKISPPADELALRSYFAIARELKDAYPESYNSLGTLIGTIAGVAKTVLPQIMSIFPVTAPFAPIVSQVAEGLHKSLSREKPITDKALQTTVSEAQLEHQRESRKPPLKMVSPVDVARARRRVLTKGAIQAGGNLMVRRMLATRY